MCDETHGYLKILSWHSSGRTEEKKNMTFQLRYPALSLDSKQVPSNKSDILLLYQPVW